MKRMIFLALLVTACGDSRPPAPTAEQNRQLNEAESMLDAQAKEKGPANAAAPADPSHNQN
jgi:hypothetical protein